MKVSSILSPDAIEVLVDADCKKRALLKASDIIARVVHLDAADIFKALLERERLGSTSVGRGVALPHALFEGLDKVVSCLITLKEPIAFEEIDDEDDEEDEGERQGTDILFVLLAPKEEEAGIHLRALATVASIFKQDDICQRIRDSRSADTIYKIMTSFDE